MQRSSEVCFLIALLLTFFLAPERLTAQEPQDAQAPTATPKQPPAAPDLANLIPLATTLSNRLVSLEKTTADEVDLSQVEKQLADISVLGDKYAGQFTELQTSVSQRAGRLPALQRRSGRSARPPTGEPSACPGGSGRHRGSCA